MGRAEDRRYDLESINATAKSGAEQNGHDLSKAQPSLFQQSCILSESGKSQRSKQRISGLCRLVVCIDGILETVLGMNSDHALRYILI